MYNKSDFFNRKYDVVVWRAVIRYLKNGVVENIERGSINEKCDIKNK